MEIRVENGPQKGTKIPLPPSGTLVLGSEPKSAQIVLVDPEVARIHCALTIAADGSLTLKDLGAPGGTFVNGKKIASAKLAPGDRIQAGTTVLLLAENAPAAKTLGGYRIEKLVGKGGMGTVYRAVQISLDRIVALKVLSPQLVADRAFVELFFREARAAGKLNHPNVVQVFDVGEANGMYFYSMEFMEGGTIEGRIQSEGKLPLEEAIAIVRDAARGLQYAESQKIVHRDIKPDNLMLAPSGHAKIADLGLAAPHETADAGKRKILGTPHFISPEQARGLSVDSRSDLYSLGATFFRILTGKTPFSGKDVREILQKQVQQEAPRARSLDPEIPEEIDAIIAKLLEKDPAQRFQSAKELADELEAYLNRSVHTGPKVWILAGIPLALLAVTLVVWKPWETRDPLIVEKVIERPDDPAKAAEAERLRKELFEKDARIAFQAIRGSLSAEERLAALDRVATQFADTAAGASAKKEADSLRQQIEEQRLAAQARKARLEGFEARLRERVAAGLAKQRYGEAFRDAAASPDLANPEIDEEERKIADSLFAELAAAAMQATATWLQEAEASLEAGDFPAAATQAERIASALAPTEGIPEREREAFLARMEDAKALESKIGEARKALARAKFESDAKNSFASLFAGDSLLREIAAFRFPAAAKIAQDAQAGVTTPEYRDFLTRWQQELDACERAMQSLVGHIRSQDLAEKSIKNPLNGRTQPLLDASREDGVAVPDPAKRDSKLWISWENFQSTEQLGALFHKRWSVSAAEASDTAQLLLLCGIAFEAGEFRKEWRAAIEARAWEKKSVNGQNEPQAPLFDLKVFQQAKEFLEKAESLDAANPRVASVRERIQAEEEAATLLSRAFGLLYAQRFDDALHEMESLSERCSSTFLFGIFSDGSAPLVAR